jgi:hypothetical protein
MEWKKFKRKSRCQCHASGGGEGQSELHLSIFALGARKLLFEQGIRQLEALRFVGVFCVLLDWGQAELAEKAAVEIVTVRQLEGGATMPAEQHFRSSSTR